MVGPKKTTSYLGLDMKKSWRITENLIFSKHNDFYERLDSRKRRVKWENIVFAVNRLRLIVNLYNQRRNSYEKI